MRGNSLTNTSTTAHAIPPTRPRLGDGQDVMGLNTDYSNSLMFAAQRRLDIMPMIGAGTTTNSLTGTCGKPLGLLTRIWSWIFIRPIRIRVNLPRG